MRNTLIRILCCLVLIAVIVPCVTTIPANAKAPKDTQNTQQDTTPTPQDRQNTPQPERPSERYQWAYSGGGQTFQFDTHTLQKINDPYRDEQLVEAWVRVITPNRTASSSIVLQQYYFRLNTKQIQLMSSFDLASDGQVGPGNKFTYDAHRWQDIVPGTAAEGIYNAVTDYAAIKFPPPKEKGKFLGIF
ncbi:hypothetical protein [Acetonema longum]|uniref:Uncharacterized protein n=1 Tax=Acetonema longum DSM 6540 TaxID=1009370 RepID=F7NK38_9FIRM|nr:hypothetical protein [Acetonema longum]EGO63479.1 hypothetical protein ALO_12256 [Acetonema longum DSM 6540]